MHSTLTGVEPQKSWLPVLNKCVHPTQHKEELKCWKSKNIVFKSSTFHS